MTKEQIRKDRSIKYIKKQREIQLNLLFNTIVDIQDKELKQKCKKSIVKEIEIYDYILSRLY